MIGKVLQHALTQPTAQNSLSTTMNNFSNVFLAVSICLIQDKLGESQVRWNDALKLPICNDTGPG
ncbi:hypothetical protein O9993_09400 [Vibrio lentus]|nr:hypothetical protein [Vibrio lentus]